MLSIGDFSRLGQVTVRTLRLYDELNLLKPAHVDRFSGYRYYSIEQLPRLNRVLMLKDLDFSLEQIASLLKNNLSADQLREMLGAKQREIEAELQENAARLGRVAARLRQVEQEGQLPGYDVVLKRVEPQAIVSTRQVVPTSQDMGPCRCTAFGALYGWLEKNQIEPAGRELVLYHNTEYCEQDIDMEVAIPVDRRVHDSTASRPAPTAEMAIHVLPPAPTLASVIYQGRPTDVEPAVTALWRWIGTNGYVTSGPYRELHLYGKELELASSQSPVVMELQVPVEKRRI